MIHKIKISDIHLHNILAILHRSRGNESADAKFKLMR